MRAVVLAAGEGRRLRPITLSTPKPLLPTPGFSMVERLLRSLSALGVSEVDLVVSHLGWRIRRFLGRGDRWNLSLSYVDQGVRLGTGHAFLKAMGDLHIGEDVILLYSDVVFPESALRKLMDADPPAAAVAEVEEPWRYGVVEVRAGLIVDLVEKPERGEEPSRLVLAGAYHLDASFSEAVKAVKPSPRGEIEITDALREEARARGIRPIELGDDWIDAGVPADLLRASKFMLEESSLEPRTCPSSHPLTHCGRVLLGSGAEVGPFSVVGSGSRIGTKARVMNSLILSKASVGSGSRVEWAVISEGAFVPEDAEIVGTPEAPAVVGPWVRSPRNLGPGEVWFPTSS